MKGQIELVGTKFMINLEISNSTPSGPTPVSPFSTANSPFNKGRPLIRCSSSRLIKLQTPRATSPLQNSAQSRWSTIIAGVFPMN